jgi:replicative DNA helicase
LNNDLFSQYPETAVLSLIMQDGTLIDEISDVKTFMLSSSVNRNLFDSIIEIRNDGLTPDYGLVIAKIQERGRLNDCGGESYLKYLYNQTFEKSNIKEFSSYIVNAYKSRQLLGIVNSVPNMVTNISEIDTVISNVRTSLDELNVQSVDKSSSIDSATKETWEELVRRIENPNKIDFTTGIKKLDAVTGGYWKEDVWVVAGRPGSGKTSFLCNSILSGVPSLVFSLEMGKQSLLHRLWAIKSGVSIFDMRLGQVTQSDLNKIADAAKELKSYPIYINTDYVNSLESVLASIRKHHRLYGIQVVHIDYLQLLAERTEGATNELGRIMRSMKLLARDLGVTNVIYSQLNRGVESREDKRPILSDLRQSGNIEEDTDVAIFLYRDEMYNKDTKHKGELELLINKQRQGPVGVITAKFIEQTNRILDE